MRTRNRFATLTLALAALALLALPAAAGDVLTKAPDGFQKVSELTELPEFMPGMGTLWVDPDTLPAGPFLGYDRDGELVNVTLMVPLDEIEKHTDWTDLGSAFGPVKVDHVDLTFNPGHSGVSEAHYHVTLWRIPHDAEKARLGEHTHAGHAH